MKELPQLSKLLLQSKIPIPQLDQHGKSLSAWWTSDLHLLRLLISSGPHCPTNSKAEGMRSSS